MPQLSSVIRKTADKIIRECKKVSPAFDSNRIHSMRTRVKKLRALLRFCLDDEDNLNARLPKSFRKVYEASGSIRDAHVMMELLMKDAVEPLPRMAFWLARKISDGGIGYKLAMKEGNWNKDLATFVKQADCKKVNEEVLQAFFKSHLQAINDILSKDEIDDEDLHDIRKKIKDLQFVLRWSKKQWPKGLPLLDVKLLATFKKLGDLAGDYNDLRNAIDTLAIYMKDESDDLSLDDAQLVLKTWEAKRSRRRNAFLKAVKKMHEAQAAA